MQLQFEISFATLACQGVLEFRFQMMSIQMRAIMPILGMRFIRLFKKAYASWPKIKNNNPGGI